jgi:hypothetical protein
MGPFFMKGVEGHVANGMPWPIQNGLFCCSFYHFFVHDTKGGPIGFVLRRALLPVASWLGLDDYSFAAVIVSLFMQIMGQLQIPAFLGPSFSPFHIHNILDPWVGREESKYSMRQKAKRASKKKDNAEKKKEL